MLGRRGEAIDGARVLAEIRPQPVESLLARARARGCR